jgi:creatinine amidohydrolase
VSYVDLSGLTWPEVEALKSDRALGLIPIAALEQHGPHLPLATDSLIADLLARLVAERLEPPVVVVPVLRGGLSTHHLAFPGTVTIPEGAFREVVLAYVEGLERMGIREVAVFSTHGGNFAFLKELSETVQRPGAKLIAYSDLVGYLAVMMDGARSAGLVPPASDAHAGGLETSQALYAFPELVRPFEQVSGYTEAEEGWLDRILTEGIRAVSESGVLGDPSGASAAAGKAIFDALADELARWIGEAFGVGYGAGAMDAAAVRDDSS